MVVNWCAYNAHNIRVGVVARYEDGFSSGRHVWGLPDLAPIKFPTLEAAKRDVEFRHPTQGLRWEEEDVSPRLEGL